MSIIKNPANTNSFKPFTGYVALNVLAFDPSNDEYNAITGRALPYELSYDANDDGVVNHRVLVKEHVTNTFHMIDFRVGTNAWESTNNKGKFQWIDASFNTGWGTSKDGIASTYVEKETAAKCAKGTAELTTFLKMLSQATASSTMTTIWSSVPEVNLAKAAKGDKKHVNLMIKNASLSEENGVGAYVAGMVYAVVKDGKIRMKVSSKQESFGTVTYSKGEIKINKYYADRVKAKYEAGGEYPMIPGDAISTFEFAYVEEEEKDDDLPF